MSPTRGPRRLVTLLVGGLAAPLLGLATLAQLVMTVLGMPGTLLNLVLSGAGFATAIAALHWASRPQSDDAESAQAERGQALWVIALAIVVGALFTIWLASGPHR